MARDLTPKQRLFVEEYLVDLNGTQAAIRAGYSRKTANEQAARMLADVSIQAHVQAAIEERIKRTGIAQDQVLTELSYMAFYDPADFADVKEPADIKKLPPHQRKAIIGWTWNKDGHFILKLAPKTPSQELIGRHLKMFTDKVEHNAGGGAARDMSPLEAANRILTLVAALKARKGGSTE